MLSAPTSTAPAASSRSINGWSCTEGASSRLILEPARVGRPCTSNRFFTANGTPASGPTVLPAAMAASTARAVDRARSAVTSVKEFRTASWRAIRASAASATPSADNLRLATALAISAADSPSEPTVMAISGCKDTGGLGFVRQHELIDQPRQPQRHLEIGPDRRLPGVIDRQRQRLADGGDVVTQRIGSHHPPNRNSVNRQRRVWNRRQQLLCIRILRIAQDALRRPLLDDAARSH